MHAVVFGARPLMMAPMQGLTNRAFRATIAELASPDVLFTEFVRVRSQDARHTIVPSDFAEATSEVEGVPLVVQIIGSPDDAVGAAAALVERGVKHINVNMGCPWGRMTSILAGGGMFRHPETIAPMLKALRAIVPGTLSVKTRAGIEDPGEVLALTDEFAAGEIDFLVVHPRTVAQKYKGEADHAVTRALVEKCPFAVIANGDLDDARAAEHVLEMTGAHGAMFGRAAVRDPWVFDEVRGAAVARNVVDYLSRLLVRYTELFCGDAQVLAKLREVLTHVAEVDNKLAKKLKKARRIEDAREILRGA